jgi:hypothetical protein
MNMNGNDDLTGITDPPEGSPPVTFADPSEDEILPVVLGPPIKINPIALDEAQMLLRNYLASAQTPASPVKGVYLDRSQLEAMNKLVEADPALHGFRLFFGREGTGVNVGIVVGVDEANTDQVTKKIYKTMSAKTGPCPPVCDKNSPIKGAEMS